MTEQEVRDFIAASFIASTNQNWTGNLISSVVIAAVKVAKERGIIPQEEKFCEHGFIAGSDTCSAPDCVNYGTKEEQCSYTDEETGFRCVLSPGHAQPNIHAFDI